MRPALQGFNIITWYLTLATEEAAIKFMQKMGLIPTYLSPCPACPLCGYESKSQRMPTKKLGFRYVCYECRKKKKKKCYGSVSNDAFDGEVQGGFIHPRLLKENSNYRAKQSEQAKEARLQQVRQHAAEIRATESKQARAYRLQQMRQRNAESRRLSRTSITGFKQAINTFCDKICEVCTKRCYKHQISRWIADTKTAPYLPNELKQRKCLVVYNRSKTHLSSKKNIAASKPYWNNLDPASIPEWQYCFRGQSVLFAQDVFEVIDLPNMLPRTTNNAGIVVITERLENINVTRVFSIVVINEDYIIRVKEAPVEIAVETNEEPTGDASANMETSDSSRIVRVSWHQGNDLIFTPGFAGVQWCATALVNILRTSTLSPQYWSTNIFNLNITGDQIDSNIRFQTARNLAAYSIENDQYLFLRNFKVIKIDLDTYSKRFRITFDEEPSIYGSLNDKLNEATLEAPYVKIWKICSWYITQEY
ncbi:uncharacterized protein CDAR_106671 [Caerostris darwini]|uniref:Uncharacterized protein n=1 Tax=Caerostris darwini TaxID=1538125 RepID=A0AAV4Q4Z6_9ARAC|nr:uncharacterized protein CDAR_106671 [Caerostris darwini]